MRLPLAAHFQRAGALADVTRWPVCPHPPWQGPLQRGAPPPLRRRRGAPPSRRRHARGRAPAPTPRAYGQGEEAAEPAPTGEGWTESDFESAALSLAALHEYQALMARDAAAVSSGGEGVIDVLEGAVLIARHRYPRLTLEEVRDQLDDLAEQVAGAAPHAVGAYPLRALQAISAHLYAHRGIAGNSEDYYHPDNSCINAVLSSRRGIPITLALLYSEVASRLGVELIGVNLPGHFFLTPADPELQFLVDPFEGGQVVFRQDAEATLARIYGRPVEVGEEALKAKRPHPPRLFLGRMLNNLKQVYVLRKDFRAAHAVTAYLRATRPGDYNEVRDQGVYLYYLRRYGECIETLEQYLAMAPPASEDVAKIKRLLGTLGAAGGDSSGGAARPP